MFYTIALLVCYFKQRRYAGHPLRHIGNTRAKFPHSPILHYACRSSRLTENNGKNNTTTVGLCAVFVVSW